MALQRTGGLFIHGTPNAIQSKGRPWFQYFQGKLSCRNIPSTLLQKATTSAKSHYFHKFPVQNAINYWGILSKLLQNALIPKEFCPWCSNMLYFSREFWNSFMLVFTEYRKIIARYVAKWGIAQTCLSETKCLGGGGGVTGPFCGVLTALIKYRAIFKRWFRGFPSGGCKF